MIPHGVWVSKPVAVVLAKHEAARRRLFVCHRNAAKIGRPTGTVSGIKGVVHLPGEVVDAEYIEPPGIVLAEQLQKILYKNRFDVKIHKSKIEKDPFVVF